jgi:hypothetical protein
MSCPPAWSASVTSACSPTVGAALLSHAAGLCSAPPPVPTRCPRHNRVAPYARASCLSWSGCHMLNSISARRYSQFQHGGMVPIHPDVRCGSVPAVVPQAFRNRRNTTRVFRTSCCAMQTTSSTAARYRIPLNALLTAPNQADVQIIGSPRRRYGTIEIPCSVDHRVRREPQRLT